MTDPIADAFNEAADPTEFGRQLREQQLARWRANQEAASDLQDHRSISDQLRAASAGLYGLASPQERAAELASRDIRVGDGAALGTGRALERNGGRFTWTEAGQAVPASVDLTNIDPQARPQTTERAILAHLRENNS